MTTARYDSIPELAAKARNLGPRFGPQSSNRVQCRGDKLSRPIYWRGRQWAATRYGVEARDGSYAIERRRLWEEETGYGWIRHMAEKNWVDLKDFAEALRVARIYAALRAPPHSAVTAGAKMTPAQQMEVRRLTPNMWTLLRYAHKMHPSPAEVYGPVLRSARILERRGFLSITPDHSVALTDAGLEACQREAIGLRAKAAE